MYTIRVRPLSSGWCALIDGQDGDHAESRSLPTRADAVAWAFTALWLQIRLTPRRRRVSPLAA